MKQPRNSSRRRALAPCACQVPQSGTCGSKPHLTGRASSWRYRLRSLWFSTGVCFGEVAKRKDNITKLRTGILAAVAALILVVVGVGLYYSLGFGGSASGEPYIALDKPDGTGDVDVVYFFSYECPHCRSFDDLVDAWQSDLPDGAVVRRVHVAYSSSNRLLAKAHRALKRHDAFDANHQRLFRALQDRNRRFATPNALAQFVDGFGVDQDAFLRTLTSTRTAREVDAGERRFISLGLTGVPALVVDDKYIVNMDLGRKRALAVTDDLVEELLARRSSS